MRDRLTYAITTDDRDREALKPQPGVPLGKDFGIIEKCPYCGKVGVQKTAEVQFTCGGGGCRRLRAREKRSKKAKKGEKTGKNMSFRHETLFGVYTARCRACGEVIAASMTRDQCLEWIERGLTVDLVDEKVSVPGHAPDCPKRKK